MKIGYSTNRYGTRVSTHICDACKSAYTVCPAVDTDDPMKTMNRFCTASKCSSYNEDCDVDRLFDEGQTDQIFQGPQPTMSSVN